MEQLEAEAILLAGSFDNLAGREQDRSHPVATFGLRALVDEQQSRLQDAP